MTSAGGQPADTALISRAGSALLGRRVSDLAEGLPLTCVPRMPVAEAATLMSVRGVDSIVVVDELGEPLGIVTDRDLRSKVVARALTSAAPVSAVMSSPLVSVSAGTPAFEALLEMTRRSIHHLGVVEGRRLVAVVSSHDMVLAEGAHPLALARAIEAGQSLDALATSALRLVGVVRWLVTGGAGVSEIGRLVAELNDRLVIRALALVEGSLEAEGHGRPPVAYSWLVAGSEGRREQTLKTDQDNALVYADSLSEDDASSYFALLGERMGAALVRLGFPECPGGFMASNPRWRKPERVWREYFASWMENPQPEAIVHASLFFDLRPVAGDPEPGRALRAWACERAPGSTLFLRHLARDVVSRPPALGWFGRLRVERSGPQRGRLDLKATAVFPLTQAMRVSGLSLGLRETHTLDRLSGAEGAGLLRPRDAADLREAYETVSRLRLARQLRCLDMGLPPDNFLDPRQLSRGDRLLLKDALHTVAWLQRFVEDRFQTDTLA